MASRRLRAAIMQVIPGWVFEECVAACKRTEIGEAPKTEDAKTKWFNKMVKQFKEYGVSENALKAYIGGGVEKMTSEISVELKSVYNMLQGGGSPAQYFEMGSNDDAAGAFKSKMDEG